jgi:hypothetical protein
MISLALIDMKSAETASPSHAPTDSLPELTDEKEVTDEKLSVRRFFLYVTNELSGTTMPLNAKLWVGVSRLCEEIVPV